jgi:putative radical SAM enzyme (TIGR03279 family)
VHATEPAVRERLLGVNLGGGIVNQLRELTQAGIEVHTQIVLCPGWNDGAHLDRTINDLWAIGPGVLSLSVVPVGLTSYNIDRPVRLLTTEEAAQALRQLEAARTRALQERGIGWAYAADEMFFAAQQPIPAAAYYDDWPLTENGVGAVRRLIDDFAAGVTDLPKLADQRIAIVTGTRMAPVFAPLADRMVQQTGAQITVLSVVNRMFGETVTTAGLLPGRDIAEAIRVSGNYDVVLIPAEALNDNDMFIDDVALDTLRNMFGTTRIVAGHELIDALQRAGEEGRLCDTGYQP